MKKLFLLCCCLLLSGLVDGQKSPEKFGEIKMEDMTMESYPLDTSAVAVILLDYCEAITEYRINDMITKVKRHRRIKILKKGGLSYGNVSISLYKNGSTNQVINNLKGATYNLERGKIVSSPVSKENMFTDGFNKNIDIRKIAFPNVKEGSIIETSYTVDSEISFIPD